MEPRETSNHRRDGAPAASDEPRAARILAAVRLAAEACLASTTMSERIHEVLGALGSAAGVSRAYVFQNLLSADGELLTSQCYEWVDEGIEPQIDNPVMQRMSYERMGLEAWSDALSAGRLHEANLHTFSEAEARVAVPQGVESLILVPLMVDEGWWGFIGFDECKAPREWSAPERDALQAAGSILSAAIQSWRARDEKERHLEQQRTFTQAAWRRAAEWEAVVSAIVDGVWVLDNKGVVTFANEGARRLLGVARAEELLGPIQNLGEVVELFDMAGRPFDAESFPACRSALKGEAVDAMGMQIIVRSTRRRRYVRMSSAPLLDTAGSLFGAVAIASDVTESVEFARLKDQFIRVAAHELKTPVAIMKGYAQLALRTGKGEPPAQLERLRAIDRGADRIDRIVHDLLGVSQIYAEGFRLETKSFDLRELTVAVIGDVSREHPDRPIDLIADSPAPVVADEHRIAFAVSALIDNAIRYSSEGTPITVRVGVDHGEEVRRPSLAPTVSLSVTDRGVGVPSQKQVHVFEPFFRAHTDTPHDRGGMGVGLFTSREIVRQHGGEVWFESTEGMGSTFHIQLPLGVDDGQRTQGPDRR